MQQWKNNTNNAELDRNKLPATVKIMDEKEKLEQIISEYENVASHYNKISFASRGAIISGQQRTSVYNKVYSNTQEFIAWASRIRAFLNHSSVSESDEARQILNYMETFKEIGEDEKLKKLLAMLKALHENWILLSHDGMAKQRLTVLAYPKFELKCIGGEGSTKSFSLKNVSSVHVSEISVESFDLICLDGSSQNLFIMEIAVPTSLGPNETGEFTYNHRYFIQREHLSREFRLVFTVKDEYSNQFRCVATKNVDNPDDKRYMLGQWSTHTECTIFQDTITKEGRETIVYNNINIGGNAQNVQIQQGSDNSTQMQRTNDGFVFDAAQKVLDEIMKYQPMFDEEFGEKSKEIVDAINAARDAIVEKDQSKLKSAWNWIKSVAANATGGMIAAGIPALLSKVVF